ncbi:glycosyltransferase family 2 protein [Glaciibacter sp. 2TAF33]|uniref:glycosyltransferase family 2 protein n=1 Tax=Glaciibacter sp. 2TAF33 TaxID=3233015 RepID=UPI003F90BFC3
MTSISVVIPSYNDAVMLEAALTALAGQLRPADEIIVVDNASTDATASVAHAAGARVVSEPVRGIWPAAAAGYDAASCDIIARLDADSVPPTDWVAHLDAAFTVSPGLDAITGPGAFYDAGPLTSVLGETLYIRGYFWAIGLWLAHPPLFGSNFAMRRTLWQEVAGRVHRTRDDVHDDLDLSFHLPPCAVVAYEPTLRVGISARPFDSWAGFARRLRWAWRTLALHLPEFSPWRMRAEARASRADAAVGADSPPGSAA